MTRKRLFKKSPAEFLSCLLLLSAFLFSLINHAAAADCQNQLTVRISPATINCGNITSPQFSVNPSTYPSVFVMEKHYTLTAVPEPGYVFDYWTVNYTVKTAKTITVSVVDGQKTVTAYFKTPEPLPNTPPVAKAGPDAMVSENVLVTLDASQSSDSDDGIRRYGWEQTAGDSVTLSNAAAINPTFTAPAIPADPIVLTFLLTVEDFSGATDQDTVTITVEKYANRPPTADAGDNGEVVEDTLVTLDASGSFDPDDGINSYRWEQTAGDSVTLSDTTAVKPTFTAPPVPDTEETVQMQFSLIVKDVSGAIAQDSVYLVVKRAPAQGGGGSSGGCFVSGLIR